MPTPSVPQPGPDPAAHLAAQLADATGGTPRTVGYDDGIRIELELPRTLSTAQYDAALAVMRRGTRYGHYTNAGRDTVWIELGAPQPASPTRRRGRT